MLLGGLGGISISQVLVNVGDESLGDLLSLLVFLLLISTLGLGDTSLGLKGEFSSLLVVLVGLSVHSSQDVVVGVKSFHSNGVLQWVLLLLGVEGLVFLSASDGGLDGIGVDDLGNIGVGEGGSVQVVAALFLAGDSVRTEDLVEGSESGFTPDDESAEMTTGGELLKVKSVDVADFNTGDVSDGSDEGDVFVVENEKGTSSETVSLVSELTLTSSDGLGVDNSFDVFVGTESLQQSDGISGLFNTFDLVFDDQRKVGDVGDSVTSSHNEGSHSGSSKSSSNCVSLLLDVDLSVPSSPGLKGSEHSTLSAGVGEGTLSSSGSTRSTDSGYSGNGTTWTPGDGGMLHTGMDEDSVSLSNVLRDLVVDELDDIESDGSSADSGESDLVDNLGGVV